MPHRREMLCACGHWLRCKKNEVGFGDCHGHVTAADLYECPNCRFQILTGFGGQPYSTEDSERQRHIEAGTYFEEVMR